MSLTDKLQLRQDQKITLVNPPQGFDLAFPTAEDASEAVLAFVRDRGELETLGEPLIRAAQQDRLAWLAYPKAGQLGTDLSRDVLRELTQPHGIRPIRQVSLDHVWSALRFRPT